MRMLYPMWLKFVLFLLALAVMSYISVIAAYAVHPSLVGEEVRVAALCAADPEDDSKPAQPSWDQILSAIEASNNDEYRRIMADVDSTCLDLRIMGAPGPMSGVLMERYRSFKIPSGECRSTARVRIQAPNGNLTTVFTWLPCLPEA